MDIAAIAARPRHQTKTQLWVRSRESMSARRIESGDSATLPFWSTDSALFTRVGSMEGSPVFAAAIGSAAEAGAAAVRANHHLSRWSSSRRVDVALGATTRIGTPTQMATLPPNIVAIDAMPDRQRFLALVPERAGTGSATVVLNWQAALGKIR